MSQNKRQKMDVEAVCSSASVKTQEMSISVPECAQQQAAVPNASGTNKNKKAPIFNSKTSSFKKAVKWRGFVDKTLLIAELLKERRHVMIFAPRRFGKSMNIDMVKCFFEIEPGRDVSYAPQNLEELKSCENYQAFCRYGLSEPCKIMKKTDLVKEHFGRHPVVHLDFKDIDVSSIESVKHGLKTLVHNLYLKHSYLKDDDVFALCPWSARYIKKGCELWCDEEEYPEQDAKHGLNDLVNYLHDYHERKVYFLVDEFDAPAVNSLLEGKNSDEVVEIVEEVTELVAGVVEGFVKESLLGSLITGVSYLTRRWFIYHPLEDQYVCKWLSDDRRFYAYYGLTNDELTTLLEHVFPEDDGKQNSVREEVKGLYNGYYFKDKPLYCLWSVLHYIRVRSKKSASDIIEKSFWGNSSIISKLLRTPSYIMNKIINLINGGTLSVGPCEQVDLENLARLNNDQQYIDENDLFSFLIEQGYLSRGINCYGCYFVKVPNPDVLAGFREMFYSFYKLIPGFEEEMNECSNIFKNMLISMPAEVKLELTEFYNHLKTLLLKLKQQGYITKSAVQAAMYFTMLKASYTECCMEKHVKIMVENRRRTGKIDLWMCNDDFAVIWKFKCYAHSDFNLTKASSPQERLELKILGNRKTKKVPFVSILDQFPSIKSYLLIGISVDSDEGQTSMCYLKHSQDIESCVFFPQE